jgi:hypothetical protein
MTAAESEDEDRARDLEEALRQSGASEEEISAFLRHVRVTPSPGAARLLSNWRLGRSRDDDRRSG